MNLLMTLIYMVSYFSALTSLPKDKQFHLDIKELDKVKAITRTIKPDIVISCL